MAELTISSVYGTALFEVAQESGRLEEMRSEIGSVVGALDDNPDFFEFLCMPTIPKEDKKQIIKSCFEGQISAELLNFLYILVDKKRIRHFREIAKFYQNELDRSRNISEGVIYSAEPLTAEEIQSFENQAEGLLRKTIRLKNEQDASIIGGVKIFIEGKVIDATVRTRLHELKERLSQLAV